jgi:hypothetical protein
MINSDRISQMVSSADAENAARGALKGLVEYHDRRSGSKTVAYELVAGMINQSSSWVKKFLAKHPEVKEPRITTFLNIRLAYEVMCSRIEAETRREGERAAALKDELNAITDGFVELVNRKNRETQT